jgi:hypothetical protein
VTEPHGDATASSSAAEAYRNVVSDIIDSRRGTIPVPAGAPQLSIVRSHRPTSVAQLSPAEAVQLRAAWYSEDGPSLDEVLADEANGVEAAEVVDETGVLRYHLYGWNYGVGYLFPSEGLDVVAFGSQHDIEHWSLSQRDLFAAMDRALRAGGHGFTQPLHFCWEDDSCWDAIANAEPHTVGSEPYLREFFARAERALAE